MSSIRVDLSKGPCVEAGHDMFEQLVGAHLAASGQEDLLALVNLAMTEILETNPERAACVAVQAAYHGQAMVVKLLGLIAQHRIALDDTGLRADPGIYLRQPERYEKERVGVWNEVREHLNVGRG